MERIYIGPSVLEEEKVRKGGKSKALKSSSLNCSLLSVLSSQLGKRFFSKKKNVQLTWAISSQELVFVASFIHVKRIFLQRSTCHSLAQCLAISSFVVVVLRHLLI